MENLATTLFNILFNLINIFVRAMCAPLQLILSTAFNGIVLTDYLSNFYTIINTYIIPSAIWFTHLVPPMTWNLIVIYFTFQIAMYSVVLVSHYIIKPLKIVKKLIPFT